MAFCPVSHASPNRPARSAEAGTVPPSQMSTGTRESVFAATYQYNPRISGPNKRDPHPSWFQQQYEFDVLLPGHSATVKACGYPPDQMIAGFWQTYTVSYQCGGETNDSNNKYSNSA